MSNNEQLIEEIKSRQITGIIFDWDGTLLDISAPLRNSVEEGFKDKKIDIDHTIKEIGAVMESIQGFPMTKIILQSHDIVKYINAFKGMSFMSKLQLATKIFSKYLEYEKDAPLFPEVETLLKHLSKDLDLYVVSHSQTKNIINHLEKHNLKKFFKGIFGADNLPVLKPDPKVFHPVMRNYKPFHGDDFIVIGDMPTDIEAGREAGIWTIGITSGISDKEVLKHSKPDLIISSLAELLDLFGIPRSEISKSNPKESLKVKS
ncbi:MAG: HAD family hydrolase [Candidatus Lokiarchaeota archaeon]